MPSPVKLLAIFLLLMIGGTAAYALYERVYLPLFRKKQPS